MPTWALNAHCLNINFLVTYRLEICYTDSLLVTLRPNRKNLKTGKKVARLGITCPLPILRACDVNLPTTVMLMSLCLLYRRPIYLKFAVQLGLGVLVSYNGKMIKTGTSCSFACPSTGKTYPFLTSKCSKAHGYF